ncbi:MAG: thermonuclease family protein [Gammaproteobacteria bacterium]|nr:thermonuclease family protein [Gammaproteobacteria bacterium]
MDRSAACTEAASGTKINSSVNRTEFLNSFNFIVPTSKIILDIMDCKPIVYTVSSGYLYPTIKAGRMFCLTLLTALFVFVYPVSTSADEVKLLADNTLKYQGDKITLADISVPQATAKCQGDGKSWPCGAKATLRLNELIKTSSLRCTIIQKTDAVSLARCSVGEIDLGRQLVEEGWALTVGMESEYIQAEQEAKRTQSGIWRDEFSPPDTWRQYPDTALNPYLDLLCSVCATRKQSRNQ